jgi:hypothetical protein
MVSAAPALMFVGYAAASNGSKNLGRNLAGAALSVAAYAGAGAIIGAIIGADEWQRLRVPITR